MELQMAMDSISGLMEASIKEILNMELGMDMGYGQILRAHKFFQGVIEWIKNKALESTNG